jgi:flavin-dependent dehydrogenase
VVSYKGHFPTSPARNPYGDRYITVGDSTGWLRPFKGKGITTAVMTGISAAKTMMNHGISKKGLDAYAAECEYLTKDYPYGTLVRYCSNLAIRTNYYDFLIEYAKKEDRLARIFYDSVSGHRSYKNIIFEKGNLPLFAKLGAKFIGRIVGR